MRGTKNRLTRSQRRGSCYFVLSRTQSAAVQTAIEYEYRFTEYRFAEYEYDEIQ